MLLPLIGLLFLLGCGVILLGIGLLLRYVRRISGPDWPQVERWIVASIGIALLLTFFTFLRGC